MSRQAIQFRDYLGMIRVRQVAGTRNGAGATRKAVWQAGHPGGAELRVIELDDCAGQPSMLGPEPFADRPAPTHRGAGAVADLFPLRGCFREEQLSQLRVQSLV